MDFFGTPIAAPADRARRDQAQHVKVGNQHRHAARRQRGLANMMAGLVVHVVDLSGLNTPRSRALREEDGGEDELLLRRKGRHDGRDLVSLDLRLSRPYVPDGHAGRAFMLGFLGRNAKQVQRAACVTVLLGRQRSTESDDAFFQRLGVQGARGTLNEDVAELIGVVGIEHDVLLTKSRADTWVKEIGELQVCLLYTSPSPRDS